MYSTDLYFGSSAAWARAQEVIDALAPSDLPIVLLGPTGCGKSALASYIHRKSKRPGSLVEHTIPSRPDNLSYSAFLGYNRGAYTGAVQTQHGLLELAKGGTLFLDEMGHVTHEIQGLLLGLLDGRPFTPLGATRSISIDVRFVFATNAEPKVLMDQGKWLPDLYYRLGGNFIRIPSLAARRLDILPLAHFFLWIRFRQLGRDWRPEVSQEVQSIFLSHPWPGNIRQLKNICDCAAVLMQEPRAVEVHDLTTDFLEELGSGSRARHTPAPVVTRVHQVLRKHHGNKSATARELDMHRTELYRFLDRHPYRRTPSGGFPRPA